MKNIYTKFGFFFVICQTIFHAQLCVTFTIGAVMTFEKNETNETTHRKKTV